MEKAVKGAMGPEGKYAVDFVDGKFQVELGYEGAQAELGVNLKLDLVQLLEIAASKTDNKIDDAAVGMIRGML